MSTEHTISIYDIKNTTKTFFQEIRVDNRITLEQLKDKISRGGRFIIFKYQISLFFAVSFRRLSPAIFIENYETTNKFALKYNLFSLFFGWWFIPHGPYDTITSVRFNLKGGLDVTEDIMLNIDEQGFADRNIKYLKTNQLFTKPDKWDLKSYRKVLLEKFDPDFGIRTIVVANYINSDSRQTMRFIGLQTNNGFDKYAETCKEVLSSEFRNYALFEFFDLNDGDKSIGELLIAQGEIILNRDKSKL